jgi:hypothetical protein
MNESLKCFRARKLTPREVRITKGYHRTCKLVLMASGRIQSTCLGVGLSNAWGKDFGDVAQSESMFKNIITRYT